MVIETCGGGSGRHVLDLCEGLARLGHQVTVVFSPNRAESDFLSELGSLGQIKIRALSMESLLNIFPVLTVRFIRCLQNLGPFDIVHAHGGKAGVVARLGSFLMGLSVVYTPHGYPKAYSSDPQGWVVRGVERLLVGFTARIIAVSRREACLAAGLGVPENRIVACPNGVGPAPASDRTTSRAVLGVPMSRLSIGFVGRLVAEKDPDLLLDGFNGLMAFGKDVHLTIIGDGPLRQQLEAKVRRLGLSSRVGFHNINPARPLLAAFDVLVLTSLNEGFPYVFVEALHAALPIVATCVGGVEETVHDGKNGRIVRNREPRELSRAIAWCLFDDARRRRLSEYSHRLARGFTSDRLVRQMVRVYACCIDEART